MACRYQKEGRSILSPAMTFPPSPGYYLSAPDTTTSVLLVAGDSIKNYSAVVMLLFLLLETVKASCAPPINSSENNPLFDKSSCGTTLGRSARLAILGCNLHKTSSFSLAILFPNNFLIFRLLRDPYQQRR